MPSMARWLMKTEPEDYSWERLEADGETEWTGVRNHQAARSLRSMAEGDPVFFYRSVVEPAVLGIMRVSRTACPDPADPAGPWVVVRVRPERRLAAEVTLQAIKADPRFADLALVRQSRLSVMPVADEHWRLICAMGGIAP
jgi:predicted RNA-binding protein with PUA-like domain